MTILPPPATRKPFNPETAMFKSIRVLLYASFIIIGLSLLLVILLGVRQYRINAQYSEISSLSERTLFSFSTIRDQVTESMVSGSYAELKDIIPDIEQLNSQVTRLYDYPLIPAHYKLAMTDTIDLSGLVINLRKLNSSMASTDGELEILQELRRIGENLIKVDRIITGHIRDSVIGFQLSVIGTMGVLISCASFILIGLYFRGVKPLLELSRQIEARRTGEAEDSMLSCSPEAGVEIVGLVESVNEMVAIRPAENSPPFQAGEPRADELSRTINETTNNLNAVINYAELLLEAGPDELTDEQRQMLKRIVESGGKIGDRWQSISQEFDR
jgi:hypothetical protein